MPKNQRKPRRKRPPPRATHEPTESRAIETLTVAWTVSVTGVLVANLIVVAAHLYGRAFPEVRQAQLLEAIMLLAAAVVGVVSLALLAVVWRTRRVKPPRGYVGFAVLVAVAPIIVLVGRLVT